MTTEFRYSINKQMMKTLFKIAFQNIKIGNELTELEIRVLFINFIGQKPSIKLNCKNE